jgi:hypothetical protein
LTYLKQLEVVKLGHPFHITLAQSNQQKMRALWGREEE